MAEMDAKFLELINEGEKLKADFLNGYRYRWYRYSPLNAGYALWKAACLDLVKEAFGAESALYAEMYAVDGGHSARAPGSVFSFFLNALKRARLDLRPAPEAARATYAADTMDDFLSRAEAMAGKGHFISAATLAGAVLEDLLRRLCEVHDVFCAENARLETVNDKLHKAGVYDEAVRREVALNIGLRRTAELCYTEKLNARNVSGMISWIRGFVKARFTSSPAAPAPRPGQASAL